MANAPATGFECHSFSITTEARFLLHVPKSLSSNHLLVIATHGYGMTPTDMLRLVLPAVGDEHVVASIEAPHQHYSSTKPGTGEIGYNWGTSAHWQSVIRTHHDIVLSTLERCSDRFSVPASRSLLIGFSQPVGLNYRLIASHPDSFRGVIGICGGIPRDWEDTHYHQVPAALLHVARNQDEYYTNEIVAEFPDRLRLRAPDVEFHLVAGPHRFPSTAGSIVRPWMERVFPTAHNGG